MTLTLLINFILMDITPTLYIKSGKYNTNVILTLHQFTNNALTIVNVNDLSNEDLTQLLELSPTGSFPLLKCDDLYISGSLAIINYLTTSSKSHNIPILIPSNSISSISLTVMWMNYATDNIWPILEQLFTIEKEQVKLIQDETLKKEGQLFIDKIMERLNKHLQFNTYFIGSSYSLVDLMISVSLKWFYSHLLDSDTVKKYNNVTRWMKLSTNMVEYKAVNGEIKLL